MQNQYLTPKNPQKGENLAQNGTFSTKYRLYEIFISGLNRRRSPLKVYSE